MARIREPVVAACKFEFRVSCGDDVNSVKIGRGQGVSTSALISMCIFPLLLLFILVSFLSPFSAFDISSAGYGSP